MQYTPYYNLNLPEGTDIVNPLIQDNPNYTAIDNALYANKQRVVGTATHTKVGTNHSIVLADSDIPVFRFVATGDYATGDTFTVDGVTVTARAADGSTIPNGAFKINSTVLAILDGTLLNLINISTLNLTNLVTNTRYESISRQPGTIINYAVIGKMCVGSAKLVRSAGDWTFTDDGDTLPIPTEGTTGAGNSLYGLGSAPNGSYIGVNLNGAFQIQDYTADNYTVFVSFFYPVA